MLFLHCDYIYFLERRREGIEKLRAAIQSDRSSKFDQRYQAAKHYQTESRLTQFFSILI